MAGIPITFGFIGTTSRKRSANRFISCTSVKFGSGIQSEMTANPRLAKGQTGVSPQRPTRESHRKGPHGSLTAKAQRAPRGTARRGKWKYGSKGWIDSCSDPWRETIFCAPTFAWRSYSELSLTRTLLGMQSRSEFTGLLLLGLPVLTFLVRRRIDRAGWSLLGAPGVPHGLQFLDFIR